MLTEEEMNAERERVYAERERKKKQKIVSTIVRWVIALALLGLAIYMAIRYIVPTIEWLPK